MKFILSILIFISVSAQGQFYLLNQTKTNIVYDVDAKDYFDRLLEVAFFTPTDTEKSQINTYIVGLKNAGIWIKIYNRYLLFWGNAFANAQPLKSGNIVWTGTVSHTATGVQTSGTGHGKTGIIPLTHLSIHDNHVGIYSQTDLTSGNADIGCRQTATSSNYLIGARTTGGVLFSMMYTNSASKGYLTATNPNSLGYMFSSRSSSTVHKAFKNGVQLGTTNTATDNGTLPNIEIYLCSWNNAGTAATTERVISMATIGKSFTDAEAAEDNTLTEALMDARLIGVQ